MAASFIRKAVSDVHEIKNLANIPQMKRERDAIRDSLYEVGEEIKKQESVMAHKTVVKEAIDALTVLNKANVFSDDDHLKQSENVTNYLSQRVNEVDKTMNELREHHHGLTFELDKISSKIKKVRGH